MNPYESPQPCEDEQCVSFVRFLVLQWKLYLATAAWLVSLYIFCDAMTILDQHPRSWLNFGLHVIGMVCMWLLILPVVFVFNGIGDICTAWQKSRRKWLLYDEETEPVVADETSEVST